MSLTLPRWFKQDGDNAAVLGALEQALALMAPEQAVAMMYLQQAAGRHLDAHGALYGVPRLKQEQDDPYRLRLLASVLEPRSTEAGIKAAIEKAFPGVTVEVQDFFEEAEAQGVKSFDGSWFFDGSYNFTEVVGGVGGTYAQFFIDVTDPEGATPLTAIRDMVERYRAAGYIPTIRLSRTYDTLEPSEFVLFTPVAVNYFDGSKTFDGSWTFLETAEPVEMAFGDGGFSGQQQLPASPGLTALRNETHRQPVVVQQLGRLVVASVLEGGANPGSYNEVGLFDALDRMIAYATFKTRVVAERIQLSFRFLI